MSAPGPARPAYRDAAAVASGVIGLVALLVALLVAVRTDHDSSTPPTSLGSGVPSAGGGARAGGGGGTPATSGVRLTKAYVEQHFPVPPAGRRDPHVTPPAHEYWYVTYTNIETVRQYYLTRFRAVHVTCDLVTPPTPNYHGYGCAFGDSSGQTNDLGHMQIRNRIQDYPPSLVLVQGYFDF